jgi:uncharacterized protein YerC
MTDDNDDTGALVNKLFDEVLVQKLLETPMLTANGMVRGRRAALTRAEAQAVKEDMRPYEQIAKSFGISKDTIMRVKRKGRYKDVPYIPSDVDPAEYGYLPRMSDYTRPRAGVKGRPFKNGRAPLTEDEIAALLADRREAQDVADTFNVPLDYVRRLRKKHKVVTVREQGMPEETKVLIALDPRPNWMLAREYKYPEFIIEKIKEKYADVAEEYRSVTPEGNEDEGGV